MVCEGGDGASEQALAVEQVSGTDTGGHAFVILKDVGGVEALLTHGGGGSEGGRTGQA